MNTFHTILYGASCYALGAACRDPEHTLILHPGLHAGSEFTETFLPGTDWETPLSEPVAEGFRQKVRGQRLAALTPALAQFVLDNGLHILCGHVLREVVPCDDGGVLIRTTAPEGKREFRAEEFLDTVTGQQQGEKCFNAMLRSAPETSFPEVPGFLPGAFPGEGILHFPVPADCSYAEARLSLERFWRDREEALQPWKITGTALSFGYKPGYPNAAAAINAGIRGENRERYMKTEAGSTVQSAGNDYDVIVAGAGTAGAIAALCSAEHGLRVLVLEKTTYCGGIGTGGQVINYYYGLKHGRHLALDRAVSEREAGSGYTTREQCFCAELKKIELEQAILNAGAELHYGAAVTDVLFSGEKTVCGVEWVENGKRYQAKAKYVIDATGDGQAAFLAGAAYRFGRDFDGVTQPYTLNYGFTLGDDFAFLSVTDPGNVNQIDSVAMTEEVIRKTADLFPAVCDPEKHFEFFTEMLCPREGRLFIGEENLTFDDVVHDRLSTEPVAWEYSNWDTHAMDLGFESELAGLWGIAAMQWSSMFRVPIPKGALIPKGYSGLLLAGRMLAVDHDLSQAVRMKDCMHMLGEAAAAMAYLSIRDDRKATELAHADLSRLLPLPEYQDENRAELLYGSEEEILAGLRTEKPGKALWSAYRYGKTDYLKPLLSEEGLTRYHGAFALGILRDPAALSVLRETAGERNETLAHTPRYELCRQEYGAIAVWLLGYLRDEGSLSLLKEILYEGKNTDYRINGMMSLYRIHTTESLDILREFLKQELPSLTIQRKGGGRNTIDAYGKLRELLGC